MKQLTHSRRVVLASAERTHRAIIAHRGVHNVCFARRSTTFSKDTTQSKLAAAITKPVTNETRQENNSNSFRILMTIGNSPYAPILKRSPVRANILAKKVTAIATPV